MKVKEGEYARPDVSLVGNHVRQIHATQDSESEAALCQVSFSVDEEE